MSSMQALIIGQDQNSNDLIKAVFCYKGCRVLIADELYKLEYLREEIIDIVFLDLSSLYSMAYDLTFSSIKVNSHERPVIITSEKISLSEEIELQNRNIFFRTGNRLDSDEIGQIIDAAIKAVLTMMPELRCNPGEIPVDGNSLIEKQMDRGVIRTSKKVAKNAFWLFPNIDRRVVSLIQRIEFKYAESTFSFIAKPIKNIDTFMTNLAKRKT